ncbi:uncharacterized protein [Littorina saxatilis]|uniref:uncharacterized protein n=1 Tax=Littorina saxatilis TaxID=31220 RepID=UPI0038B5A5F5
MYLAGMMKRHSQNSKNKKDASISSACKLQRLSSGRPGQPALVITKETLLTMRNQGLTRTKMAEALGISNSTIKRRLKDFNISLRKTNSKEGMNGSGSDTGMSLFGEVQGVLKIGKTRGVQDMTPLCAFSDVATRQSEVTCANSGQSVPSGVECCEVAAVSSCSPVAPLFQGQGRKRKHHRITTADFKRITTDDIRGEDYPDVDMVQKITVAKCLIPDLSAPAQALDSSQSAGEYDYEKQSYVDGGQHAIAPGGTRVKEGGGIVAECGGREGYAGHAQSSHSEIATSISFSSKQSSSKVFELLDIPDDCCDQIEITDSKTEVLGVPDKSLVEIELIPELQEEMQQMECRPPGELQDLEDVIFNSLANPAAGCEEGQAMADVGLNGDQKHSICWALYLELDNEDSVDMMAFNLHPQTETPKPLAAPDSGASPKKGGGEARPGGVLNCHRFEQEPAASTVFVSATVTADQPLFRPQQPGAVRGPGIVSQGVWVSDESRPVVQNSFSDDSVLENGGMAHFANAQPHEQVQFSFIGKTMASVQLGQIGTVAGPLFGHTGPYNSHLQPNQTEHGMKDSSFMDTLAFNELGPGSDFLIQNEYVAADQLNGSAQFQESWQGQGVLEVRGASQMIDSGQGQIDQQMLGHGGVWPGLDEIGGPVGQQIPVQVIQGQEGVLSEVDEMGGGGQSAGGGPSPDG